MNWPAKPQPKLGDEKQSVWFALFPVKVENKWVWLEKYIVLYEYQTYHWECDVVVSEGIFTEKYYTEMREAEGWIMVGRKLL